MNDVRRDTLTFEPDASRLPRSIAFHAARWAPVLGLALLTYLLYPLSRGFDAPMLDVGEVAPTEVLAPFEFAVRKSAAEMAREGEALAGTVRPIYEYHGGIIDSSNARVDSLFTALDSVTSPQGRAEVALGFGVRLTSEEAEHLQSRRRRRAFRTSLERLLGRTLTLGVPAGGTVESELSREIVVRRAGRERVVRRDSVLSYGRFLERRADEHPEPNSSLGDQIFLKMINAFFRPTLIPNGAETEALRAQLRASVDSVKDVVRQNERIINAHEVVTPEARDRLVALRADLLRQAAGESISLRGGAGQVVQNALIISIFWLLLTLYRRETYRQLRQVLVLALLFGLVVVGAAVNYRFINAGPELIPIPFATMLITVLLSGRVSMVAAAVLAVLLGTQVAYGGPGGLYLPLLGGVGGALSVRAIRSRTQVLTSGAIVTGAFILASTTLALRLGWSFPELGSSIMRGAANAVVSAAFVTFALPIFESLAGVTTDMTLLELSDPSRPLLRKLATEAPGTYAHSIAMANLCEAACNAVGANGLLARVGCYYHDIGKLKKPQFFVENQAPGVNPHDKLKPDVSAGIIRNHIRDGLALAEEHRLPEVIKAFIPEHHGTAEITYFLERARSRGIETETSPEHYRYPGPRPQSVETAVALLADGVEAGLRVLDEPTPQKIAAAIDHIVRQRITAGQLEEAPLTLAQLNRVKAEFVRVLTGMHHNRIDYPKASGGITAGWQAASPA